MDGMMEGEAQMEIECDADKFVQVWFSNTSLITKVCPQKIPKLELIKGSRKNWHAHGSIINWTFVSPIDGKLDFVTTKVEEPDEDTRSVSYNLIDGQLIKKFYKTLRGHMEVTPTDIDRSVVKWRYEYEKLHEDAPEPDLFVGFLLGCAKDVSHAQLD